MSSRNYQYLDHDLNPAMVAEYTLLLLLDTKHFSFAVSNGKKLLLLAEGLDLTELSSPGNDDDLLFRKYGRTVIAVPDLNFTLMPFEVFSPDKVADFARFLDVKPGEKVFSQHLDADNQVLFKTSGALIEMITEHFDVHDIVFGATGFIKAVAENSPLNHQLFIQINDSQVELLNYNNGKLRFYNHFDFFNEDELAYFTTLVADELQISAEELVLYLSGEVNRDDNNFSRLQKFFPKVEISTISPLKLPSQFASHSILTLTALALCGSSAVH